MAGQVHADHVAEDQVEQRRDERLSEHETPRHEEADRGVEGACVVGVQAAGRRQVPSQLTDADRDEKAGDQRKDDGQRRRAAGVGDREDDGERDRRRRSHMRDRLEQDWRQADRVALQPGHGTCRTLGAHRFPPL